MILHYLAVSPRFSRSVSDCGDDVVDRIERNIAALGGGVADAIGTSAPGEQRVLDGSRAATRRLPPEFLDVRLQ